MILEIAEIQIKPETNSRFEAAVEKGVTEAISTARGFMGYKLNKGIESKERYILMIFWQTLENHTVDFRSSSVFQDWRALVGPYFAEAPVVEHFSLVAKSA